MTVDYTMVTYSLQLQLLSDSVTQTQLFHRNCCHHIIELRVMAASLTHVIGDLHIVQTLELFRQKYHTHWWKVQNWFI